MNSLNCIPIIIILIINGVYYGVVGQSCVEDDLRVDCYLVDLPSQLGCMAKGCNWCEPGVADRGTPSCYLPPTYGYKIQGLPQISPIGINITLARATNITYYNHDSPIIQLQLMFQSNYRIRIKIRDDVERWEVPLEVGDPAEGTTGNLLYDVQFHDEPVFHLKVLRASTGTVLFDTSLGGLTFSDQFLQIGTKLPSRNLYGIGENEQKSFRHDFTQRSVWPLFTRDQPPEGNANMYGVHPHYTVVEPDGNTHAVIFVNSNAQEFVVMPTPGLLYRTIGGVLDMYIFLGPTPETVVQQYTEAVGRMDIPPYWSLGFQLCKYNYGSLDNVQAAVNRTASYGIPHDVQYIDSDLMERELDFTLSQDRYSQLPNYIQSLHARGMKFITIIDPGISNGEVGGSYPPFDLGTSMDVFIKKANGRPVEGKVWPADPVQYPDFTKANTTEYWITLFTQFKKIIDFDGIWIDMNEPVNFASGDLFEGCEINAYNTPPFIPHIRNRLLSDGTLCPDHRDSISVHYNTHSLYGWFQAIATKKAVLAARPGKRSFILSRSTFVGSGRVTAHWLGDNFSLWSNLHTSIIGMLQFNLWGIPQVGADICGFIGNTTADLCLRWQQLGAFYPFSRNHNGGVALQDPGYLGAEVARAAKQALETRYLVLPYLYTLFYYHNIRGDTVARALWHEFPTDPLAMAEDKQFLWGSGLMICPALEPNVTSVNVYFPRASRWYDFYSGREVVVVSDPPINAVAAPLDQVVLFLRGGVILPTQDPALNTVISRNNPFHLLIPLDFTGVAEGRLYFDDGDSRDPLNSGEYFLAKYTFRDGDLTTLIENDGYPVEMTLSSVRVLGSAETYTTAILHLKHKDGTGGVTLTKSVEYEAGGVLVVADLQLPMNSLFTIRFLSD